MPEFELIITHKNNGDREIKDFKFKSLKEKRLGNESALVIINAIGMFLPYC